MEDTLYKHFFTVGPSAIHPMVPEWTKRFYDLGLGSISHRSSLFQSLYRDMEQQLRQLMHIPDSHITLIASSGSEIFQLILQNCVETSSTHIVNGAFSHKFYTYANKLGLETQLIPIEKGTSLDITNIPKNISTELIAITHNETSTGYKIDSNIISKLKEYNPKSILAVDIVSSAPFDLLDYQWVDCSFFSVQKAFGLPAGLGIWIINRNIIESCMAIQQKQKSAHNTLTDYMKNYTSYQTPSTPNIMGVYLLHEVAKYYNYIGKEILYNQLLERKKSMIDLFTKNTWINYTIKDTMLSDTIIVADLLKPKENVLERLRKYGILCSSGYGEYKDTQLRFSNFPSNNEEDFIALEKALQ